jgi:hypothetical protein
MQQGEWRLGVSRHHGKVATKEQDVFHGFLETLRTKPGCRQGSTGSPMRSVTSGTAMAFIPNSTFTPPCEVTRFR